MKRVLVIVLALSLTGCAGMGEICSAATMGSGWCKYISLAEQAAEEVKQIRKAVKAAKGEADGEKKVDPPASPTAPDGFYRS